MIATVNTPIGTNVTIQHFIGSPVNDRDDDID
jgi:hypothetical protein